jgi:hypothetical protein
MIYIIQHTNMTTAHSTPVRTNTFGAALSASANLVTGDNGALLHDTSGNIFVDYFTNIHKETTRDVIEKAVAEMVSYTHSTFKASGTSTETILDLFKFWAFKRGCHNEGEGLRDASHYYLLALYDHYPETVAAMMRGGLSGEYGYWKDIARLFIINSTALTDIDKYNKYNPLVDAMATAVLDQRSADIKALDAWCHQTYDKSVNLVTRDEIVDKMTHQDKPNVSLMGKWIVSEGAADNKKAYWYISPTKDTVTRVNNASFFVRRMLKTKNSLGFPMDKQVPYGALKNYRQMNAKLRAATETIETLMCTDRWDLINPKSIPSVAKWKLRKALLNERLKEPPTPSQDTTGNRHPDNKGRVACRVSMREHLTNPEDIKTAGLVPHQIACAKSTSCTDIDYQNAMWEAMVISYRKRLSDKIAAIAAEDQVVPVDEVCKSVMAGNFLGVADISGSMGFEGVSPNRPMDVSMGLTAFMSEVASENFRDLSLTFSETPRILKFKNHDGSRMTVAQRMSLINTGMGYNTNVMSLHTLVIQICKDNKVNPEDLPTLVIFSDGEFDCQCETGGDQGYRTTHQNVVRKYAAAGFSRIPTIVYWNLSRKNKNKGTQTPANYPGVMFLQGDSPRLFDFILYGESAPTTEIDVVIDGKVSTVTTSSVTPEMIFRKAMTNEDFYSHIHQILLDSKEHILAYYN